MTQAAYLWSDPAIREPAKAPRVATLGPWQVRVLRVLYKAPNPLPESAIEVALCGQTRRLVVHFALARLKKRGLIYVAGRSARQPLWKAVRHDDKGKHQLPWWE